jgi:hypothetical protein
MKKEKNSQKKWVDYYEGTDILEELLEEPVEFSMNDHLRKKIKERDIGTYIDDLWGRIGRKLRSKGIRPRDIDKAIKEVRKLENESGYAQFPVKVIHDEMSKR